MKILNFDQFVNESEQHKTLDNGGVPFIVDIDKNAVIFKQAHSYSFEDFFDGSAEGGDQNAALLFHLEGLRYLFVGSEIYEFDSPEPITEFFAKIGNSEVPYPVALTDNKVLFMLDKQYVSRDEFASDTDWADAYGVFYKMEGVTKMDFENVEEIESRVIAESTGSFLLEKKKSKKPKGAPDWHDSDAPDANGKFKELGINALADWLIRTRGRDMQKINGSLNQQIVFNRKKNPSYAKKMESTREAVKRKLGKNKDK
jgi:hypothetical protein